MKRFMTGEWKVRVCGVLLAVTMAAGMTACGSKSGDNGSTQGTVQAQTDGVFADGSELGEGNTEFTLTVTDKEGTESSFTIHTDKENVGDAIRNPKNHGFFCIFIFVEVQCPMRQNDCLKKQEMFFMRMQIASQFGLHCRCIEN